MDVLENTLVAMLYGNNWILGKQHHSNCWNLYSELTHTAGFLLMSLTFRLFTTFAGIELIFQQVSSLWLHLKLNSFVKILMKVDEILQHLTNPMLSKIQLNFPTTPCSQTCSTVYNVLTILSLRLRATIFFWISQGMMAVFYRWCVQIRNFIIFRYEISSGFCASRFVESVHFCQSYSEHERVSFLTTWHDGAEYMLWPCVHLSVTSKCSVKMAQQIIMQTTPYDGPQTPVTVLWVSSSSLHVADLNVCLLLG